MSRVYEAYLQEQLRPYKKSDKYICAKCINDKFVGSYIKKKGNHGQCSFCNTQRNVIPVNDLLDRLEYYLDCMYDANDNPAPVDRGEYLWDDGVHFFDFIDYDVDCSEEFKEYLKQNWDTSYTYYASDIKRVEYEGDELFVDWDEFVYQVSTNENNSTTGNIDNNFKVLSYIRDHIVDAGGVKIIRPGQKIYRARRGIQTLSVQSLGVPPAQFSLNNRLSLDGSSCFYGAFLQTTCLKEIGHKKGNEYSIGEWISCRPLCLIDLSDPDYYGMQIYDNYKDSIWDKEKLSLFPTVSFLSFFVRAISVDVQKKNDNEKKKIYAATQLVGEYFRKYRFVGQTKIDGILYRCSRDNRKKNILVFCNSADCCDQYNRTNTSVMLLQKAHTSKERSWEYI